MRMNAVYDVVVSKRVRKFVLKQDAVTRKRLGNALLALAENPYSGDVKRLSGHETVFRKRVGSYRILYEVIDERLVVNVIKLESRGDVYKDI